MRKSFLFLVPALMMANHAYATDVKLPDGTPASVTIQTPCTSNSYKEYETCISAILSIPSNRGGDVDVRSLETLLPKDIQRAAIISGITSTPVMPMTVSLKHYDDKNITWPTTDTPLDHIIIPNNGTYQVVLTTNDGGKTWGMRVVIEQPGSAEQ
ncbi:hypothetical protein NO263_03795 [Gluconacetobacter entanii]|uniref:Uncharacterized protein n=1 Tax=Gluconacetobacter entanii TaxID=108528 RepID=A0ABT3K2S9_9PROT|nr:hypothetical protein [Gluconacetobacter entanii]MCW4589699.1 hypothetical protein [Gluconacetobacter entanii]MCW4593518.1 hypothetical protein [Gluconacetobacter entanii]NPC90416.1 hypothetical protein [Gluconacetobacter entanii]